jgi:hypothetical protein
LMVFGALRLLLPSLAAWHKEIEFSVFIKEGIRYADRHSEIFR